MAIAAPTLVFPYGTFPVDPVFSAHYTQDYSRAHAYILPDSLPYHHPLLRRLEGTYLLANTLPPWWDACVTQVKPDWLKPLLTTLSAQEFRTGCIEQSRWKAFRETLSEEKRRQLPQSPRLAALIERTDWSTSFGKRGPADAPDQLTLVISTRPLDFLYMSNGREWRSCQHFRDGSENYKLPGNFYDTGVAVAMVLAPNTCVEEGTSVLARTTLRVFRSQGQPVVAIGRTYHNNETVAFLLLRKLAEILDGQRLSWGWMTYVNALSYCENGCLGPELSQRIEQSVYVKSEPCGFPHSWDAPYIDGGAGEWERDWEREHDEYYWTQLDATIELMHPRVHPHVPAHALHTLAHLAATGMLPRFL